MLTQHEGVVPTTVGDFPFLTLFSTCVRSSLQTRLECYVYVERQTKESQAETYTGIKSLKVCLLYSTVVAAVESLILSQARIFTVVFTL